MKYYIVCLALFLTIGCGSNESLRLVREKNNQLNDYLTITKNELHLCKNNLRTASEFCEDGTNKIKSQLTFCYQEKNFLLGEINEKESEKRSCIRENVSLRNNLKHVASTCNAVCEDCD